MKDNIKKAVELAEQEVQEKEVSYLKNIIKDLLQKKKDKEEDKRELEKEIKVISQTIDDFKAGRLDKIKELVEKDEVARKIVPIKITIIQDNRYIQYPLKPYFWNYDVVWNYTPNYNNLGFSGGGIATNAVYTGGSALTSAGSSLMNLNCAMSGGLAQAFTTGTYNINGNAINL